MTVDLRWAVITPSYKLDFERCKLLCRSMDAFLHGPWHHYIIVDPVDLTLFRPLAGPKRTIIDKREILPRHLSFVGKIPFVRLGRMWWSWRHGPVFGWQMQQIVKLSMASKVKEEALIFFDSDTLLLRPMHLTKLSMNGAIRFDQVIWDETSDSASPAIRRRNTRALEGSARLLGLSPEQIQVLTFGDPFVTWHRDTALALQNHLAQHHGKPWQEVIGSKLMFSEYCLYIFFVTLIQKNNPNHFPDYNTYCKTLWTKELATTTDIVQFCEDLKPPQVGVCIQSLIGVDLKPLADQLDKAIKLYA